MIAKDLGVDHSTLSKAMKKSGLRVPSKVDSAKHTWKNHTHPRIGKKGKDCPVYGHKMSKKTREKMECIWNNNGDKRRLGRKKHTLGYVLVYVPDHPCADQTGYVLEHRYVMEQTLGRFLNESEIVHHKNGKKDDNRLENLELTNRADHAALHMKERYKKEAIA